MVTEPSWQHQPNDSDPLGGLCSICDHVVTVHTYTVKHVPGAVVGGGHTGTHECSLCHLYADIAEALPGLTVDCTICWAAVRLEKIEAHQKWHRTMTNLPSNTS